MSASNKSSELEPSASSGRSRRVSSLVPVAEGQRQMLAVHYAASVKKRSNSVISGSSYNRGKRASFSNLRQPKMPEMDTGPPPVQYLNTYKLAPDDEKKFRSKPVRDIIESTLERKLSDCTYKADKCRRLAASISEEIKSNIKILGFERYKIVCMTQIGSLSNQGLRFASRCLWDPANDLSVSAEYKNSSLFACVTVFGVYRE